MANPWKETPQERGRRQGGKGPPTKDQAKDLYKTFEVHRKRKLEKDCSKGAECEGNNKKKTKGRRSRKRGDPRNTLQVRLNTGFGTKAKEGEGRFGGGSKWPWGIFGFMRESFKSELRRGGRDGDQTGCVNSP